MLAQITVGINDDNRKAQRRLKSPMIVRFGNWYMSVKNQTRKTA